jgi:uncharacterized membrane protein
MWKLPTTIIPGVSLTVMVSALVGFVDAGYLAYMRFQGAPVFCGASNACSIVNASEYSNLFGVPNSYLGTLFYFIIFVMMVLAREQKNVRAYQVGMLMTIGSLLMSLYFLHVQANILEVYCPYCLVSAACSVVMFGASLWALVKAQGEVKELQG